MAQCNRLILRPFQVDPGARIEQVAVIKLMQYRLAQAGLDIGRIDEDEIIRLLYPAQKIQNVVSPHANVASLQSIDGLLQGLRNRAIGLDHIHRSRPTRRRLQAKASGPGTTIQGPRVSHPTSQPVKQGLANPVRGWPQPVDVGYR